MSDVAIKVENISKLYQIGAKRSGSLRETLAHTFGRKSKEEIDAEEFWALKDVSFEIKRGEAVGIIGKNGAGKSTLLKVLSRITEPTKGRIEINGRVASLLEVGTGFHPELTGRENIFMNGTILGMTRREIKAKFDEIVDFSGVEKFIDTPVKYYSSGMYVRLAFAVAAHLEPEILIIDEVLAVGDAEFQKKCLGKMGEVAGQGRTVLFVSHDISSVISLCETTLLLNSGMVYNQGNTSDIINQYISLSKSYLKSFTREIQLNDRPSIISGRISNEHQKELSELILKCEVFSPSFIACSFDIRISSEKGLPIAFGSLGALDQKEMINLIAGNNELCISLNPGDLAIGKYLISLDLSLPNITYFDRLSDCLYFEIENYKGNNSGRPINLDWNYGAYRLGLTLLDQKHVLNP